MSTTLTLNIGRTDTFVFQVLKDGSPYNITGCGLFIAIGLVQDIAVPALVTKTLGTGLSIINAEAGQFELISPPDDKAALSDLVTYYWETLVVLANGDPVTPDDLSGPLIVQPAVMAVPAP